MYAKLVQLWPLEIFLTLGFHDFIVACFFFLKRLSVSLGLTGFTCLFILKAKREIWGFTVQCQLHFSTPLIFPVKTHMVNLFKYLALCVAY